VTEERDPPELPPAVRPLAQLIGQWVGEGRGLWNAENPFRYLEETTFAFTGRPFLSYSQRTTTLTGTPSHVECGYLQLSSVSDGTLQWVISQPAGLTEVAIGELHGSTLSCQATQIGRTPTAKHVTAVSRTLVLGEDRLSYVISVAMNDEPLAPHLTAELHRPN
jgi:hypothetical protein